MNEFYNPKESLQYTSEDLRSLAADSSIVFPHFSKGFTEQPLIAIQDEKKPNENKAKPAVYKVAPAAFEPLKIEKKDKPKNNKQKKDKHNNNNNNNNKATINAANVEQPPKNISPPKTTKLDFHYIVSKDTPDPAKNTRQSPSNQPKEKLTNLQNQEGQKKLLPAMLPQGVSIGARAPPIYAGKDLVIKKNAEDLTKLSRGNSIPTLNEEEQQNANRVQISRPQSSPPISGPFKIDPAKLQNSQLKPMNIVTSHADTTNAAPAVPVNSNNSKNNKEDVPKKQKNKGKDNKDGKSSQKNNFQDLPPGFGGIVEEKPIEEPHFQPLNKENIVSEHSEPKLKLDPKDFQQKPEKTETNNNKTETSEECPPGFGQTEKVQNIVQNSPPGFVLDPRSIQKPADDNLPPGFGQPNAKENTSQKIEENEDLPPGFGSTENVPNDNINTQQENKPSEPVQNNNILDGPPGFTLSPANIQKPASDDMPPGFGQQEEAKTENTTNNEDLPPGFGQTETTNTNNASTEANAQEDNDLPPGFGSTDPKSQENNVNSSTDQPINASNIVSPSVSPQNPTDENNISEIQPKEQIPADIDNEEDDISQSDQYDNSFSEPYYDPNLGDMFDDSSDSDNQPPGFLSPSIASDYSNSSSESEDYDEIEVVCDYNGVIGFITKTYTKKVNVFVLLNNSEKWQIIDLHERVLSGAVVGHAVIVSTTKSLYTINAEFNVTKIEDEFIYKKLKSDPNAPNRFFALSTNRELFAVVIKEQNKLDKTKISEQVRSFDASSKYIACMTTEKKVEVSDRTGSSFFPIQKFKFKSSSKIYLDDSSLYCVPIENNFPLQYKILSSEEPTSLMSVKGIWSTIGGVSFLSDTLLSHGSFTSKIDSEFVGFAFYNDNVLEWISVDEKPVIMQIEKQANAIDSKAVAELAKCAEKFFDHVDSKVKEYKSQIQNLINDYNTTINDSNMAINKLTEEVIEPYGKLVSVVNSNGLTPTSCVSLLEKDFEKGIVSACHNNFMKFLFSSGKLSKQMKEKELSQPILLQVLPELINMLSQGEDCIDLVLNVFGKIDFDDMMNKFALISMKEKLIDMIQKTIPHVKSLYGENEEVKINEIIQKIGNLCLI